MARAVHPGLSDIATTATEWTTVVDLLLDLDLPVAVYDLAVDVLHPAPSDERPPVTDLPWRAAGYPNRDAVVDELRRRGYRGSVSKTVADLWLILQRLG